MIYISYFAQLSICYYVYMIVHAYVRTYFMNAVPYVSVCLVLRTDSMRISSFEF